MAVFQPTAMVGNGRALATLGAAGELMAFFYPRCDHAQNVREGLTGVYLDGYGFSWLFGNEWQKRQSYLPNEAAVFTDLTSPLLGLGVSVTDFMLPDEPVLVRRWQVRSLNGKPKRVSLMHYLELTLGGTERQQAVQVVTLPSPTPRPAVVQWWQGFWCGVAGDLPFQMWQCSKALPHATNHPKPDMLDGWLSGQSLEIGQVAFAVGWQLSLPAFGVAERTMVIAFGDSKQTVLRRLAHTLAPSVDEWVLRHHRAWKAWLHRLPAAPKALLATDTFVRREVLEAALWTLLLIWDRGANAPVAAPEFDPTFEASGGYGFCWCRDAAFVAHALASLGLTSIAPRFFDWCAKAQGPEGAFHQRYWLDGSLAPAWSEDSESQQLDQTAAVIWMMGEILSQKGKQPSAKEWAVAQKALCFLEQRLKAGIHATGMDLWETFRGKFTYTQATFVAAFRAGSKLAQQMGKKEEALRWHNLAEQAKVALLQKFWTGDRFLRGFTPDGHPDPTPDASVLGVLFPFGVLDLADPTERRIAEGTVRQVLRELTKETPDGGLAVWRFKGDGYAGGMASTPSTLWLGLAASRLSRAQGDEWQAIALRCLQAVTHHTTSAGLLAEMFDAFGHGYWAAGHGWSAGWLWLLALAIAARH